MDQNIINLIKKKDSLQSEIAAICIEIDHLEELDIVKLYLKKTKEKELLRRKLNIIQKELENSCNHLWYILDTKKRIGRCLICFKEGKVNKNDRVIKVEQPNYIDINNKESFMYLFSECQDEIYQNNDEEEFVRKYQK